MWEGSEATLIDSERSRCTSNYSRETIRNSILRWRRGRDCRRNCIEAVQFNHIRVYTSPSSNCASIMTKESKTVCWNTMNTYWSYSPISSSAAFPTAKTSSTWSETQSSWRLTANPSSTISPNSTDSTSCSSTSSSSRNFNLIVPTISPLNRPTISSGMSTLWSTTWSWESGTIGETSISTYYDY